MRRRNEERRGVQATAFGSTEIGDSPVLSAESIAPSRADLVAQLREFADLAEQHPEIRLPEHAPVVHIVKSVEQARHIMALFGPGEEWRRDDSAPYYVLERHVGPFAYRVMFDEIGSVA